MTKNYIKAKLNMLANLNTEAEKIRASIQKDLRSLKNESNELVIESTILGSISGSEDEESVKDAYNHLEERDIFKGIEDGEEIQFPILTVYDEHPAWCELKKKIGNYNGKDEYLAAYTSESDDATPQVGIVYQCDTDFDIAMAEVKKGEIAKIHNLPKNNKNIDVYVWENVFEEDYTKDFKISFDDAMSAINTPILKAENIEWDTDDDLTDEDIENLDLPNSVYIPYWESRIEDIESISDFLSDKYGFCHNGFSLSCNMTLSELEKFNETKLVNIIKEFEIA